MLKPDQNYRFKNGEVKTEFFSKNYVIMNDNSEIANLYFCEESEDGSMDQPQKVRDGGSMKEKEALETKSKKMGETNFALSNVVVKKSQRLDNNGVSARIGND
jgi:hypothetical protein